MMARDARIELDWADGTFAFRLGFGELVRLQEACGAGPQLIHTRLSDGSWGVKDISHVIRFGLIGGGMPPADALKKVRAYVEDRPPAENLVYAQVILSAGLVGAPDESVGGQSGGEDADPLPDGKMHVADIYGAGAVMGYSPQDVDAMSMWQFMAALEGYAKAHDPKAKGKLNDSERDELWELVRGDY